MNSLTIGMTDQQLQSLKELAASRGKAVEQYALERLFPAAANEEPDKDAQFDACLQQQLFATAPIGHAVLSPDCRYLQINEQLTEICGMSIQEHIGRSVREAMPALADSVEGIVRSILETGQPVTEFEIASQLPGKASRSWITYWHPVHGANGRIIAINVAAMEITQQKQVEAALRESIAYNRMLFLESRHPMAVVDPATGQFVDCNALSSRKVGRQRLPRGTRRRCHSRLGAADGPRRRL